MQPVVTTMSESEYREVDLPAVYRKVHQGLSCMLGEPDICD